MASRPGLDAPMDRPPSRAPGADAAADAGPTGDVERLRAENEGLRREIVSLKATPTSSVLKAGPGRRARAIATPILVIVTSIALVGATVGIWFERTVWNTDRYVELVAPLAEDAAVTDAVANRLTTDVFTALDIQGRVSDALASIPRLPESATFLAGPITAGAQDIIRRQVETFLASPTFQDLWVQLNRRVHTKIVALLEGDYQQLPNVSVTGGEVRLNLVSAVAMLVQRVVQRGIDGLGLDVTVPDIPSDLDASAAIARLGGALGITLSPDFGQVTLMTKSQLTDYQQAADRLTKLGGALAILTVLLVGLTLLVAVRGRRALIWLGIAGVAALLLGGIFIRRVEGRIVDSIQAPGARAAAEDVFAQVSSSLRGAGVLVGALALLVALGAYLAGRPPWVRSAVATARRVTAAREGGSELQVWVSRNADATRIGAIVVAVAVLFVTGIDWLPVAVVGAALGLVLWRIAVAQQRTTVVDVSAIPPDDGPPAPART